MILSVFLAVSVHWSVKQQCHLWTELCTKNLEQSPHQDKPKDSPFWFFFFFKGMEKNSTKLLLPPEWLVMKNNHTLGLAFFKIFYFFILIQRHFFIGFRERNGGRKGEKHPHERETSTDWLLPICVRTGDHKHPNQGWILQPRHVLWLGIKPATF